MGRKVIVILILLNVLIRCGLYLYPFWGLEYEDSFIFNDAARGLAKEYPHDITPWKTQSCANGSFDECYEHAGYGGHFLTYPYLIAALNSIIGYTEFNAGTVNLILSIILLLSICFITLKDQPDRVKIFALVLFCVTPFVTVFHTSGLAETTSSLIVLLFFTFSLRLSQVSYSVKHSSFWLCLLFFSLAIFTKRENMVLLIFAGLFPLVGFLISRDKMNWRGIGLHIISILPITLLFIFLIKVYNIEADESGALDRATFSIDFFISNIVQLGKAITMYSYWGITGSLLIVSAVFFLFKRNFSKIALGSLLLGLLYIGVYSSHYRSYYQVHYDMVHPFETLRYSINYVPLLIVFISTSGIVSLLISIKNRFIEVMIWTVIFIIPAYATINLRYYLSEDEFIGRIEPVLRTLEEVDSDDIIITDIPVVFHSYVSEQQRVIDLFSLNRSLILEEIEQAKSDVYLVLESDSEMNFDRYEMDFSIEDICTSEIDKDLLNYNILKVCEQ